MNDLIKEALEFYSKNGKVPRKRDFDFSFEHKVNKHFGSWNNFLLACKLPVNRKIGHTRGELIESLTMFYVKYGFSPKANDTNKYKELFDSGTYLKVLKMDSWPDVLKEAGLPVYYERSKFIKLNDTELLKAIKEMLQKHGQHSIKFWSDNHGELPGPVYLKERFGGWNRMLNMMGIKVHEVLSDEQIKDEIERLKNELGHLPSLPELQKFSKYSADRFRYKEPYNDLLIRLGYNPTFFKDTVKKTNEELIRLYKEFSKKNHAENGATLRMLDISDEIYNSDVFAVRFGSINKLRVLCNFKPKYGKSKYSKESILDLLKNKEQQLGRRLTQKEIIEDSELPAYSTILRYFNTTSITRVWDEVDRHINLVSL